MMSELLLVSTILLGTVRLELVGILSDELELKLISPYVLLPASVFVLVIFSVAREIQIWLLLTLKE